MKISGCHVHAGVDMLQARRRHAYASVSMAPEARSARLPQSCRAAVLGIADILAARVGPQVHHQPAILELDHARLLGGDPLTVLGAASERVLAAPYSRRHDSRAAKRRGCPGGWPSDRTGNLGALRGNPSAWVPFARHRAMYPPTGAPSFQPSRQPSYRAPDAECDWQSRRWFCPFPHGPRSRA
jgi:hypothetical protein